MLNIYIPLPDGHKYPNDEDAWFVDSLAELVNEMVKEIGGEVGGMEVGPDEVGVCVFDGNPKQMADLITPMLKRHCPKGTRLEVSYEEDEKVEEEMLFNIDEEPPFQPLPVKASGLSYRPFEMPLRHPTTSFVDTDRYIFEAVSTSRGIPTDALNDLIDFSQHMTLTDTELTSGLARLVSAGYIFLEKDKYYVDKEIFKMLPRTAGGKISSFREDAWKIVHKALLNL